MKPDDLTPPERLYTLRLSCPPGAASATVPAPSTIAIWIWGLLGEATGGTASLQLLTVEQMKNGVGCQEEIPKPNCLMKNVTEIVMKYHFLFDNSG
jgi:hypothetical protein